MKVFDVIKYEGGNDILVWKFPGEDFNTLSQLIVHESQEALFFKDGKALDTHVTDDKSKCDMDKLDQVYQKLG